MRPSWREQQETQPAKSLTVRKHPNAPLNITDIYQLFIILATCQSDIHSGFDVTELPP